MCVMEEYVCVMGVQRSAVRERWKKGRGGKREEGQREGGENKGGEEERGQEEEKEMDIMI